MMTSVRLLPVLASVLLCGCAMSRDHQIPVGGAPDHWSTLPITEPPRYVQGDAPSPRFEPTPSLPRLEPPLPPLPEAATTQASPASGIELRLPPPPTDRGPFDRGPTDRSQRDVDPAPRQPRPRFAVFSAGDAVQTVQPPEEDPLDFDAVIPRESIAADELHRLQERYTLLFVADPEQARALHAELHVSGDARSVLIVVPVRTKEQPELLPEPLEIEAGAGGWRPVR